MFGVKFDSQAKEQSLIKQYSIDLLFLSEKLWPQHAVAMFRGLKESPDVLDVLSTFNNLSFLSDIRTTSKYFIHTQGFAQLKIELECGGLNVAYVDAECRKIVEWLLHHSQIVEKERALDDEERDDEERAVIHRQTLPINFDENNETIRALPLQEQRNEVCTALCEDLTLLRDHSASAFILAPDAGMSECRTQILLAIVHDTLPDTDISSVNDFNHVHVNHLSWDKYHRSDTQLSRAIRDHGQQIVIPPNAETRLSNKRQELIRKELNELKMHPLSQKYDALIRSLRHMQ